ncbi:MMPL family transporter [Thalassotalea psychrophila]|uniref:MMPL family transporter n=1 Tax=Thalassotalea psychrophila TaxID=3065647 RepID=A0ABY9TZI9_9GAMM|nr:MMPL family transporter [Colwelliaceae bacterium SQ149]
MSQIQDNQMSLIERFVFNARPLFLAIFSIMLVILCFQAVQVKPEASFTKMIPSDQEYISNFLKYRQELASLGNSIRIVVETSDENIFNADFQEALKQISDEVFFMPGVDRTGLKSIWTPNVRWAEVTEEGFIGGTVIPDDFKGTDSDLVLLKTNVLKSGQVGTLVGNNFRSALIIAPLQDINPETGEKLDYRELSTNIEQRIRSKYQTDNITIRVVGFAKIVGDLIDGAVQVGIFFLLALIITAIMLYLYCRCIKSTMLVMLTSVFAVVCQLGVLNLLGYGINPYSMLVPFLVFAIGVSHGVQIINAILHEAQKGASKFDAARLAFKGLYAAGLTALVSDAIGFTTLMVIDIEVIQELAIAASIGVAIIIVTNLILLPILMSYVGVAKSAVKHLDESDVDDVKVVKWFSKFATPKHAKVALVSALVILVVGLFYSQQMKIGDLDAGAPELRPDSRYNLDNAYLVDNYSTSTDIFVVMAETADNQCITYKTLSLIDNFQWNIRNIPGVQDVKSVVDVSKFGSFGMNEGSLKWFGLNRNQYVINSSLAKVPAGLINASCSMAPVLIYLNDHKAETLQGVVAGVKAFEQQYGDQGVKFTLAAGNAGIEAATNIVIEKSQTEMLIWVYSVVIVLCAITFRSLRTVLCIILPLILTSVLSQGLMAVLGIGVKVATLPVIALGVGIGIDYGIYIYSKVKEALARGENLYTTYTYALSQTGKAVAFTGITLAVGVATWVFSPIKFQADMGLLLTFMFIFNMLGALILIPALAWLFKVENKQKIPVKLPNEPKLKNVA